MAMKMKPLLQKIVLLSISLFIASFIFAQGHKTIQVKNDKGSGLELVSKSYQNLVLRSSLSAINVNPVNTPAGEFTDLFAEGYIYNYKNFGKPHLPIRTEMIEIPVGAQVTVNIISYHESIVSLNDHGVVNRLTPAQPSVSKSQNMDEWEYQYDAAYYLSDNFNTDELVTVNESGIMRGVRLGQIIVSPFRYNPVENTLLVYSDIEFEIVFNNADIAQTIAMKKEHYSPLFDGSFCKLINYENEGAKDVNTVWPITYLIVAPNTLQTALQPFIQWKTKKGFNVVMGNTSTIGTTTTAIKTWIQNQYNTLSPKPTFVLFVGDVAQIPAYAGTANGGGHYTDLYYCTFDGSTDYIPELYFGRMSAENTTELNVILGKTLMHEQYTWPDDAFLDKCMMIAGVDGTYAASHGNGQIYYGIDNYFTLGNGYAAVYAYLYGTSSHPYQVMSSADAAADADVRAKVSAGLGFANYTAHCDQTGWADPNFLNSHISALANANKYPVMIANCCLSAKFDYSDAFGEQLLYTAEKGAVCYLGTTNLSYWNEDFYWGVGLNSLAITSANSQNHTYANTGRGSYDGVWHTHSEPYAQMFMTTREMLHYGNLAVEASSSTLKKYYWEIYHVMGDPSLMAYLSIPTTLTVSHGTIAVGATTLVVNTEQYAYVALSQNGVLLNAKYSGTNTSVTLTFPAFTAPGTADIVVTKQFRKPHIGTVNIVGTVLAPVADFVGVPTTVYTGNSVQFTDLSTNTPTSWAWTFTGGTPNSGTTQNPLIVYNTPGTYAVTLIATNSAGSDTETKNAYITVLANTNPPVADFVANVTTVVVGGAVNFTDLSTNTPTSWAWTFTGGTPGTQTVQNPNGIIYNTVGTYAVSLIATNAYGSDTETKTAYITVTSPTYCDAGSASAAYEYISNVTAVTINNNSTASTYTDFTALSANMTIGDTYPFSVTIANSYTTDQVLIWIDWNMDGDFADAGENVFTSATGQGPFTGNITVPIGISTGSTRMRVRLHDTNTSYSPNATPCGDSGYGEVEDYTVNILSNTAPPIAAFIASTTSSCCGTVTFTDQSSGTPTSWAWTFGDGQTSTLQNPTVTYSSNGTYTVSLIATNAYGNDTETQTNLITVSLPTAPTGTGASVCGTGTATLTATGTGTLDWYSTSTGGTSIGSGNSFTTPVISTTTTYYVEDVITNIDTYNVGEVNSATNGAFFTATNQHGQIFNCTTPFRILSVEVNAQTTGNRTITLTDAANNVLQSVTVNIPAGESRVTLNIDVPIGTGLKLMGPGSPYLYRSSTGTSYPYEVAGVVSINNNTAGNLNYYYFFYDWQIEVTSETCISSRTPVTATVETPGEAEITIATGNTTICSGTSVTFTSSIVNGGTTPAYQWKVNGANSGTNSSTFTSTTLNNNDVVTCNLTSSSTCVAVNPVTSNSITMNVSPLLNPAISVSASSMPVCDGNTIDFTATVTDGGSTPSYQWFVNGNTAGTNANTYSAVLSNGDIVTCELSVVETCTQNASVTSAPVNVQVTVTAPPTVTGASNCGSASLTLSANGSGTLEWYNVASGGSPIATGNTYTTPVLTSTTTYYVQTAGATVQTVGNTQSTINGGGSTLAGYLIFTAYQDITIVSVEVNNTGAAGNKTISLLNSAGTTLDSRTINVPAGVSRITLNFNVPTGTNYRLSAPLNTNFYRNTSGFTFPYTITGLVSITGSSNATRYFYFYSWYVTAQSQCASDRVPVTATIETPGEAEITIATPITAICSGDEVTFTSSIVNGGTAPSYQWYVNGIAAGTDSPSFTTSTLNNDDEVSCELTSNNTCITINPVSSNSITMDVAPTLDPQISVIAVTSMPVCEGNQIEFSANASDEGASPVYQWFVNSSPVGTNSSTFSSTNLNNSDVISCELTVSETCAVNNSVSSNSVTVLTNPLVTAGILISTPTSSICIGDMITFTSSITNGGTTPLYQWQVNGTNAGTGASSFSTSSLADGDVVTCILTSNASCLTAASVTSNSVAITVASNLVLSVDVNGPASICAGETATFNCTTDNAGTTPVYQWQLNGANVGINSATYTNSSLANGDEIVCVVYSSLGCVGISPVTSDVFVMIVTSQVSLDAVVLGDVNLCTNEMATLTANIIEGGTNPTYNWLVNGVSQGINSTTFQSSSLINDDVVTFELTSSGSCITNSPAEFDVTVHVANQPVADFTYVANELEITFTAADQSNNHIWEFGDGDQSGDINPVHTYLIDGMYIVIHYVANYCDTVNVMQSVNAVGVSAGNTAMTTFSVFPNPSQGTLNIATNRSFAGKAEITDISGRIVYVKEMQYDIRHILDINNLESGVYFLNLFNDKGTNATSSIKIIKQ